MRNSRVWVGLLGIEHTTVQRVVYDEDEQLLVAHVRPFRGDRGRCGRCLRRCRGYDPGQGRRRWRALDLGTVRAVLEADAPRVSCPEHGVVVSAVPWARHGAGHTRAFDDTVAWLAVQCSKTAVTQLLRVAWRTVGAVISRVFADVEASVDRLEGLRRIGIDEISYKRGHRYLTVVVDHDRRRLIWAAPGRDKATVHKFFDALGEQRCAQITTCQPMPRTGSPPWSGHAARTRCAALMPSTWWPGPPRPSTRSAAKPGTTPVRWPAASPNAAVDGHAQMPQPGPQANAPRR